MTTLPLLPGAGTGTPEETHGRFCPTCVFFYEDRERFLPGEAPDLVPPSCYYEGSPRQPGWCSGENYEEDIP